MSSKSNVTIESELLRRAINESFDKLVEENPLLKKETNLDMLKNIYGWGFVAGTDHGAKRVGKLIHS